MPSLPLVSICIPVYNSGFFVKETLESVLNQSYRNIEVIVVDDNSKDETVKIVQSIDDVRLKLYCNDDNIGVVDNWNKSVDLSTGDYIKVMGGDDLLDKYCIEKQLDALLEFDVELVTSHKYVINSKGKTIVQKRSFENGIISGQKAFKKSFLDGSNMIGEPVSGLFKRESFYRIGGFKPDFLYLIDMEFWYRVIGTGNLYCISKPLYSFRISKGSLSSLLKGSQIEEFKKLRNKLENDGYVVFSVFEKIKSNVFCLVKGFVRKLFFILLS
ncbi:MAG: glycosyltransferase [Bacteroidia bacterium]